MRPFQYHPIDDFPVSTTNLGGEWHSIQQLGLADPHGDDGANSKIKFVGVSTFLDYFKFTVRHEMEKECWIRVAREDRKKAIFIEEFNIYMPPNKSYLWVNSSRKVARELLKRIQDKEHAFSYKTREIDLQELKTKNHPQVRGGWFRDLDIEDVSTAAIFGANVSDSDEWDNYETKGTLSSLVIEFGYLGSRHSINLSASGAITLFSNYDERQSLELAEKFNNLAMQFQTEYASTQKKGSKKKE